MDKLQCLNMFSASFHFLVMVYQPFFWMEGSKNDGVMYEGKAHLFFYFHVETFIEDNFKYLYLLCDCASRCI